MKFALMVLTVLILLLLAAALGCLLFPLFTPGTGSGVVAFAAIPLLLLSLLPIILRGILKEIVLNRSRSPEEQREIATRFFREAKTDLSAEIADDSKTTDKFWTSSRKRQKARRNIDEKKKLLEFLEEIDENLSNDKN